jgi:hypothetical protein
MTQIPLYIATLDKLLFIHLTDSFLLLFCLPKIKVTKQKGSINRDFFMLEQADPTILRLTHRPKKSALLLHRLPHKRKASKFSGKF